MHACKYVKKYLSAPMFFCVFVLLCVCCTTVPDNGMHAEGTKALSPALGCLTRLTKLSLGGEYDNV